MSARDPKYPTYPKLWGGPNPVGESQTRYMSGVDMPYMTKVGPDFVARKKGQFYEVNSTRQEQAVRYIRAVDCAPSTDDGPGVGDAYVREDGSLRLNKGTTPGAGLKVARTGAKFLPTLDWVSSDEKTIVTWVGPDRYATYNDVRGMLSRDMWFTQSSTLPEVSSGGSGPPQGFRRYPANVFAPRVWVNGKPYDFDGRVVGAAIYTEPVAGGGVARYLKAVLIPRTFDGATAYYDGPDHLKITVPASTAHYACTAVALALDGNGTTVEHNGLVTDLTAILSSDDLTYHTYGTAAPFVFNSSGTEAMCQSSAYKAGQFGQIVLNWPGLGRPTWSKRTENPYLYETTFTSAGDPTDGSGVPIGGNGSWSTASTTHRREPGKADYLWGTDTLAFTYRDEYKTADRTSSFTKTVAENGDKMESSTTVRTATQTTGIYYLGAQVMTGEESGTATTTVTNSTPASPGPGSYSTWSESTSSSGAYVYELGCFDLRVGALSGYHSEGSSGSESTVTRTPDTPDWSEGYFALGGSVGPGLGAGSASSECRFYIRLPTNNLGGGSLTVLTVATPQHMWPGSHPRCEFAMDPSSGIAIVSTYMWQHRLDPATAPSTPVGAKLRGVGLTTYERTTTPSGSTLNFSYAPYAHGISPDHVLMGVSAPPTAAVGTGDIS